MVSIVVLNWNGENYIKECVDSLLAQRYENKEIIVVDNRSDDNSVDFLKNLYCDQIKIIENKENLGFPAGNNIGVKNALGEFVFLVNNDTVTAPDCIEKMIDTANSSENIGCVACKIMFYSDRKRLDNVGLWLYRDGLNRVIGRNEIDKGQYDDLNEVVGPSGCAGLWRKDVYELVGGMDERYKFYGEDVELGLKYRLLGYKCVFCKNAVVYHMGSKSIGSYSKEKAFLVERNRLWVLLKIFPLRDILVSPYFTLKRYLYNLYSIKSGKGAAARFTDKEPPYTLILILIKVYLSALAGLPHILKERRRLQKLRKISYKELRKWYIEKGISLKDLVLVD